MSHIIEYRGYSQYEIDSLTNSGQAAAMGHGPGREGAYNWIDKWYDVLGNKRNDRHYLKPSDEQRIKMLSENNKIYEIRRKNELAESAVRDEWAKYH